METYSNLIVALENGQNFDSILESSAKQISDLNAQISYLDAEIITLQSQVVLLNASLQPIQEASQNMQNGLAALSRLDQRSIAEVRAFAKPPNKVEKVAKIISVLLGAQPTYADFKKLAGNNLIGSLMNFDISNISDKTLGILRPMIEEIRSEENSIGNISSAMAGMFLWAKLVFDYASALSPLKNERINLNRINDNLSEKQAEVEALKIKLSQSQILFKEINQKIEKAKSV